jgi:hypothetical protein
MKKISTVSRTASVGKVSTARTGVHCPASGWWRAEIGAEAPIYLFKGSIMPAFGGVATVWHLTRHPQQGATAVTG